MPQLANYTQVLIAYVAPFVAYMLFSMLESRGWFGVGYEAVYTIKTALVAGTLCAYRRYYPAFSTKGFGPALIAGALGCVLWIVLARLQAALPALQHLIDSFQGARAAYNPFTDDAPQAARIAFIIVRLIGLTVIVPVMEEIFWRGFLSRYLISDRFNDVPQGTFTPLSFAIVVAAFTAVHPEILAAIAWCTVVNALYRQTANLWACVVMHAVTNGLLGGYILATGNWQLW